MSRNREMPKRYIVSARLTPQLSVDFLKMCEEQEISCSECLEVLILDEVSKWQAKKGAVIGVASEQSDL